MTLQFSPPSRDRCGITQFYQYIRWVESVVSLGLPEEPGTESPVHERLSYAHTVCSRFRNGEALLCFVGRLLEQRSKQQLGFRENEPDTFLHVDRQEALQNISEAYEMLAAVGVVGLPHPKDVYSGKFEAVSALLFELFHSFVVADRMTLISPMVEWYKQIAQRYNWPFTGGAHDLSFLKGGTLWIFLFHNLSDLPLQLDTVHFVPHQREELLANASFAFSLFDVHNVFCYFASVSEFVLSPNNHFLFMQGFTVFQHWFRKELKSVATSLRFASPKRKNSISHRNHSAVPTAHAKPRHQLKQDGHNTKTHYELALERHIHFVPTNEKQLCAAVRHAKAATENQKDFFTGMGASVEEPADNVAEGYSVRLATTLTGVLQLMEFTVAVNKSKRRIFLKPMNIQGKQFYSIELDSILDIKAVCDDKRAPSVICLCSSASDAPPPFRQSSNASISFFARDKREAQSLYEDIVSKLDFHVLYFFFPLFCC